jgi:hypothetical protein
MHPTRLLLLAALAAVPRPAEAQLEVRGMAQAIPIVVSGRPVPGGGGLSEVLVTQPVGMGTLGLGPWRLRGTLDLEGVTIPDGEFAPGAWGEGFFDRRHPHTYVHELLLWNRDVAGSAGRGWALGFAAGKGFVPFGTDDPMVRPFLRYPVNHHWSQILERAVLIAGARAGPAALEGSVFNGDEPEDPGQWPNWERFGDSWSVRVFLWPLAGLELQGSVASVASPEHRPGEGLGQRKVNVSARWERAIEAVRTYGLVEWARTEEAGGAFEYGSVLAEGAAGLGAHRLSYRFERTSRPEEERLPDDPFRAVRPHLDDNIVGATQWTLHTVNYAVQFRVARERVGIMPFVELTLGSVARAADGLFDPVDFYGGTDVRTVTVGARLDLGGVMRRMGRYGVVEGRDALMDTGHHH